ncbi:MAG: ABC transporter substrate-binding protein [Dehalococcoidia bacterium]|nr:ABC transporter substrate-binding protein [Dehalococcoidia bacterium]
MNAERPTWVTRRGFLHSGAAVTAIAATACAPQAPPPAGSSAAVPASTAQPAQPAWQGDWDKLRAAAKQEGKLTFAFAFALGSLPRKTLDGFEKEFGVSVDMQTFNSGSLLLPKILQEQGGGIYAWDVAFISGAFGLGLRDAGAVVPMRPQLFRTDVTDEKAWANGFESGFKDKEKQFGYGHVWEVSSNMWINTDLVKEDELKSVQDLLNPKWKGKMMFADVRAGATSSPATAVRLVYGEETMKKLFVDMEPAYSRDNRQIVEQLVRGQRAIILAVADPIIPEFQQQGLGKNVKRVYLNDILVTVTANDLWMLKNAPHPNAAKLFVNWILSKEGQAAYTQETLTNSRRLDVPPSVPEKYPKPGMKFAYSIGTEGTDVESNKTVDILSKMVGVG